MINAPLILGGYSFASRLFVGTGKFSSPALMAAALDASRSQMVTVALRRVDAAGDGILAHLPRGMTLLPNTSGARTAQEAIRLARLAREAGMGDFVKIEVVADSEFLMPDNEETLVATRTLSREGFIVLPYMTPDPVAARKLADAGAAAVMPLGSPIGSHRGVAARNLIEIIIAQAAVPVVVDAGIGAPSHAAEAMEMGAAAVLVNSAIADARDPVMAARAFSHAVEAGRAGFLAGLAQERCEAVASSPWKGLPQ